MAIKPPPLGPTAWAVGTSGGGLIAIGRSLEGCSQVSTNSMRPAVHCLIVFPIVVTIWVFVAVSIIVVAVVVDMIWLRFVLP